MNVSDIRVVEFVAQTDDGPMGCFAALPNEGGPHPLVVVGHDGPGIRPAVHEVVRGIATGGYVVVLPDLYHRHGRRIAFDPEKLRAGDEDERRGMLATVAATSVDAMVADARAARTAARAALPVKPGGCGIVGFCHTTRMVLVAMAELPDEFVAGGALHPSHVVTPDASSAHLRVGGIRGPLYLGFGGADHSAPFEAQRPLLDELTRHGVPAQVEVLTGAGHGFAFAGPSYHEEAAGQGFEGILAVLDRALGGGEPERQTAMR